MPHVRHSVRGPKTMGAAPTIAFYQSNIEAVVQTKRPNRSSRAEFKSHEMRIQSGCAVPWAAARKPLNDEQQNQLKSNSPADIDTNIDR